MVSLFRKDSPGWNERLLAFVIDTDSETAQEFGILTGELKLVGFFPPAGAASSSAGCSGFRFSVLVEADRDFQNQKKIVPRRPNASHHVCDLVGFRQRLIDGVSQFLDQPFEFVVEFQRASTSGFYDSVQKPVKAKGGTVVVLGEERCLEL